MTGHVTAPSLPSWGSESAKTTSAAAGNGSPEGWLIRTDQPGPGAFRLHRTMRTGSAYRSEANILSTEVRV